MTTPYPITITRDQLTEADACREGITAFDQVAPSGTLTIPDVAAHVALLSSPLAPFEDWAIGEEIIPPIMSTSGYRGTSTSGRYGTSTSGYGGTSTSGNYGTSTSGDYGTSTSGEDGTSTSGEDGTIQIKWYDYRARRYRILTGYVGEDGIKADTPYRVEVTDGIPKFVEVK